MNCLIHKRAPGDLSCHNLEGLMIAIALTPRCIKTPPFESWALTTKLFATRRLK